jgi:hypothetical protein
VSATTFTSIVLVALAAILLTMASYAWLGDWEPRHPRRGADPQDRVRAEVEALRQAIDAYEQEQRGRP